MEVPLCLLNITRHRDGDRGQVLAASPARSLVAPDDSLHSRHRERQHFSTNDHCTSASRVSDDLIQTDPGPGQWE